MAAMAAGVLGGVGRVIVVLTGACALMLSGQALLQANSAVRPMWTGPNAVVVAKDQLTKARQAVAAAQQQLGPLQQQVQQLATNANALGQVLTEAQTAGFDNGGDFVPPRRGRYRGGDDNGGF